MRASIALVASLAFVSAATALPPETRELVKEVLPSASLLERPEDVVKHQLLTVVTRHCDRYLPILVRFVRGPISRDDRIKGAARILGAFCGEPGDRALLDTFDADMARVRARGPDSDVARRRMELVVREGLLFGRRPAAQRPLVELAEGGWCGLLEGAEAVHWTDAKLLDRFVASLELLRSGRACQPALLARIIAVLKRRTP